MSIPPAQRCRLQRANILYRYPRKNTDSEGFSRHHKMILKPPYQENPMSNTTLCVVTEEHIIFNLAIGIVSFRFEFEVFFFNVIKHLNRRQAPIQISHFPPFSGLEKIISLFIKHLTFSKPVKTVVFDPE